jgi:hypothetical protein
VLPLFFAVLVADIMIFAAACTANILMLLNCETMVDEFLIKIDCISVCLKLSFYFLNISRT